MLGHLNGVQELDLLRCFGLPYVGNIPFECLYFDFKAVALPWPPYVVEVRGGTFEFFSHSVKIEIPESVHAVAATERSHYIVKFSLYEFFAEGIYVVP